MQGSRVRRPCRPSSWLLLSLLALLLPLAWGCDMHRQRARRLRHQLFGGCREDPQDGGEGGRDRPPLGGGPQHGGHRSGEDRRHDQPGPGAAGAHRDGRRGSSRAGPDCRRLRRRRQPGFKSRLPRAVPPGTPSFCRAPEGRLSVARDSNPVRRCVVAPPPRKAMMSPCAHQRVEPFLHGDQVHASTPSASRRSPAGQLRPPSPSIRRCFQDLHWRLIGPFRGGRVLAVSGVPGEPEHFYFGSVNGGVWETHDAGRTWQPIFDSQPIGSIGALAVAPSNPQVIYVGTRRGRHALRHRPGRRHVQVRRRRQDLDAHRPRRLAADRAHRWSIRAIRTSSTSPPSAIRTARTPSAACSARATAARRWQKVLVQGRATPAPSTSPSSPAIPNVIYAALWQTRRTPWSVYPPSNGPGSGLFKSTDGGDHWTQLTATACPRSPGASASPSRRRSRSASTPSSTPTARAACIARDDAGAHLDARQRRRAHLGARLVLRRRHRRAEERRRRLRLQRQPLSLDDGGKTFVPVKGAPGGDDYHAALDRSRSIRSAASSASTRARSSRSTAARPGAPGTTSRPASSTTSSPTTAFPYWVYGAQQDSGAAGVPSRTEHHRRHHT